jgi:predicted ATP-grasp superfamily ATP-dependent carboligase
VAHITLPKGAAREETAFRDAVARAVSANFVQVVIPVTDFASRVLLGWDSIVGAPVAGPSLDAYERASNKASLLNLASQLGIRVPRQQLLSTKASTLETTPGMQVVLKPARSEASINGQSVKMGVTFARTADEAMQAIDKYPEAAFPLLVQERTVGDGIGLFLLRCDGNTHLAFAHRRLREKPPSGGVSTYRESIPVPAKLREKCEGLLDELDYSGAAMIEFKQDASTGEYVLMEINARLWGSLQLAIDAGVDFPAALVAMALGQVLPQSCGKTGVRTAWEFGEIDHAIALARRSSAELHLPHGEKSGWLAALRSLLSRRWSDRAEVFRWSDPRPFFSEAKLWLVRG